MKDDPLRAHLSNARVRPATALLRRPCRHPARAPGFTLVELVMVIVIVAVLGAMAVPRFIDMGRDARLAALRTMASALTSSAEHVRVLCKLDSGCDYTNAGQVVTIAGRPADVNYGWPDAGNSLTGRQIDRWVDSSGFTISLPGDADTLFALDGAPSPVNCSVDYTDPYYRGPVLGYLITINTSGC